MTLDQTIQQKYDEHECHLSPMDSCKVCEEYWLHRARQGRLYARQELDTISAGNYPDYNDPRYYHEN